MYIPPPALRQHMRTLPKCRGEYPRIHPRTGDDSDGQNKPANLPFRDAGIPGRVPSTFLATLARIPTSDFLANFGLARKRDPYPKSERFQTG
jgi:hypothetical protein